MKKISKYSNISFPTICKWANRTEVTDKKRSGRPTKVTNEVATLIRKKAHGVWTDQGGCTRSFEKSLRRLGQYISYMTVHNYIRKQIWRHTYNGTTKPMLTNLNIVIEIDIVSN